MAIASLLYAGVIYASTLRADFLDIGDPWWVVTVGLVILLSPLYHALVIQAVAAHAEHRPFSLRDIPMESFGGLVAGELIVNASVALGSMLFLLPGIYIGLRAIYYKQSIVLRKARAVEAVRASFALMTDSRSLLWMFLLLAGAYAVLLGTDFFLLPVSTAPWIHPIAILISAAFLAWVNGYITLSFLDADDRALTEDESQPPA
jgi:hypothetical protein